MRPDRQAGLGRPPQRLRRSHSHMEEHERLAHLRQSIYAIISIFFAAQCVLFLLFALPAHFAGRYWNLFLPISAGFHLLLLILLLLFQDDFITEPDNRKLDRINLANIVTLSRVSTLPTLLVLVIAAREFKIRIPLLALVVFIFLTDFFDGRISRRNNQVTRIGRILDSASDYSLLIVLSIIFQYYSLIPAWFFGLVIARLGIQSILMAILIFIKRRIEPKSTIMGKVTVASIMVLYSLEIIQLIWHGIPMTLYRAAEWVVAIIIVISIFDKIVSFFESIKSVPPSS